MSSKSRVIRVFLSSTFKDFAEERDLLVKKVFPELRRLCRQRQVPRKQKPVNQNTYLITTLIVYYSRCFCMVRNDSDEY